MSLPRIFYGILLECIAVSVYENFQRVNGEVLDSEVSYLGTLYRDVGAFSGSVERRAAGAASHLYPDDDQRGLAPDGPGHHPDPWQRTRRPAADHVGATRSSRRRIGDQAAYQPDPRRLEPVPRCAAESASTRPSSSFRRCSGLVVVVASILNAVADQPRRGPRCRGCTSVMSGLIAVFVALLIFTICEYRCHPRAPVWSTSPRSRSPDLYDQIMRTWLIVRSRGHRQPR